MSDLSATYIKALEAIHLASANECLEKVKTERAVAEMAKVNMEACYRECRRPWRMLGAFVEYDEGMRQWKTWFQGVAAWGETPEIACDNFDRVWAFGHEETTG